MGSPWKTSDAYKNAWLQLVYRYGILSNSGSMFIMFVRYNVSSLTKISSQKVRFGCSIVRNHYSGSVANRPQLAKAHSLSILAVLGKPRTWNGMLRIFCGWTIQHFLILFLSAYFGEHFPGVGDIFGFTVNFIVYYYYRIGSDDYAFFEFFE